MLTIFDGLRQLTVTSLLVRLCIAMIFGGIIGLNRTRKQRAAGFRTYMLVCMGAAMTMILSQYLADMLVFRWKDAVEAITQNVDSVPRVDMSRLSEKVMSGIGFLAAGTILTTGRQEVKGVTTAAGLWASACGGLAIGAGFFEVVIAGFVLVTVSVWVMPLLEKPMVDRSSNMNLFVEFQSINKLSELISVIKTYDINIYDIDIEKHEQNAFANPNAVIMMHLNKKILHSKLISDLSGIHGVYTIKEIS